MELFVLPYAETDWTMEWADFAERLRERWPNTKLRNLPEGGGEFDSEMSYGTLYGAFERLGGSHSPSMIVGSGDFRDCVSLVLWYRALVPWRQALLFCDESNAHSIMLEAETRQEDILRAFKYAPR